MVMSGKQKVDTQQMNLKPVVVMSVQGLEVGAFTRSFIKIHQTGPIRIKQIQKTGVS